MDTFHQTAPESTRGLFDLPEHATPSRDASKRRSGQVLAVNSSVNSASDGSTSARNSIKRPVRSHSRSKSAITSDMFDNQARRGGQNAFGLQTLAEETSANTSKEMKRQSSAGNGPQSYKAALSQDQDESVAMSSLQDMINTLKSLPPIPSTNRSSTQNGADEAPVRRGHRKQQSLSAINLQKSRFSQSFEQGRNLHSSIQEFHTIPEVPEKRSSRLYSIPQNGNRKSDDEDGADNYSRGDALAEAEAKLMGTYKRDDSATDSSNTSASNKERRRSGRRYSDSNGSDRPSFSTVAAANSFSKRTSLQLPTLTETSEDPNGNKSKRLTFNKPLDLSLEKKGHRRSTSRNFDSDWRAGAGNNSLLAPPSVPSSRSFNLVPFTPTKVNFARDDANPHQRRPLFAAHLPFSALGPLFKARQLIRGTLRVNKRNRSDAYVTSDDLESDIYICGSRDRNRALEGDVVAIKLVDVEKVLREKKEKEEAKLARNGGKAPARRPDEEDENEIIFGGDDDVDKVKPKYSGVVVAILERAQNQVFSGSLTLMRPNTKRSQDDKSEDAKEAPRIVWFKPTDKRVPLIAIPIEQAPEDFVTNTAVYEHRLFVGSIKRWPITSLHPFGTLERELGVINEISVQTQALLADNNAPMANFSEAVKACLPELPWVLTDVEVSQRRDLRSQRVFTIDAQDAKVLDDAISVQKLGDETYEVGVHVADVSSFIEPHSPLDKEARARASSVDLIHTTVPLVPSELTNEVTNLNKGEDRLTLSVIWKVSKEGKILDTWFGKTVVNSVAQLAYEDVENILAGQPYENTPADTDVAAHLIEDIQALDEISTTLLNSRSHTGAMCLTRDELVFEFGEDQVPTGVTIKEKKAIRKIMREFKILADVSVAQKVSSCFPEQTILRRQAPPLERKIVELHQYVKKLGYNIDITSSEGIQTSLNAIQDEQLRKAITIIILKTLQPPKYFCTGTMDILKYSHYSLNIPLFAHFTSPSRRFADLIVHRQLKNALEKEPQFYLDRDTVQKTSQHCNVKKEAALNARYQSSMLFLALYFNSLAKKANSNVVFADAIVIAVFDGYFDVILTQFGFEKRIHTDNLPLNSHQMDPNSDNLTLFWKKGISTTALNSEFAYLEEDDEDVELDEDALADEMQKSEPSDDGSDPVIHDNSVEAKPQNGKMDTKEEDVRALAISNDVEEATTDTPVVAYKRLSKRNSSAMMFAPSHSGSQGGPISNPTYDGMQCSQTIKPLDSIKVAIHVEMTQTPPLLRVLAANPFM
ncbi:hypothetical protein K450DRAFT_253600 [Umbelopsis ramanniana AG]|uniref:RNB domain-containing protein n=1 Tax=Umbelopsis ramanniana AG TaxID=1314678 RepID=A0AAD5E7J6_UMBRA|nr:uncharacterized protein K450DRAFT_253600 [Umbelopsis ramanniana AG]KAI8577090.1 hypothetical protein K450DRAFT_253600 [Umbelopsis ramanniana AG]